VSAHRTRQVPRTPFMARVAFLGVAAVGLSGPAVGAGSLSLAEPATVAADVPAPVASPVEVPVPSSDTGVDDALWYGLLGSAAVAGAVGAHRLAPRPRRS
jgi:hypothetical protein